jgi:hypothetical protein
MALEDHRIALETEFTEVFPNRPLIEKCLALGGIETSWVERSYDGKFDFNFEVDSDMTTGAIVSMITSNMHLIRSHARTVTGNTNECDKVKLLIRCTLVNVRSCKCPTKPIQTANDTTHTTTQNDVCEDHPGETKPVYVVYGAVRE